MLATLADAHARNVVVGAHPGFPDRDGFGRREQSMSAQDVRSMVRAQVELLATFAAEVGCEIRFLKPHGALYNQAQREREIADGVLAAAVDLGLPVLGQPATLFEELAHERGVRFVAEGFPDRRYRPDGRLAPRSEPGAVVQDHAEIGRQAVQLASQGLGTLCVHGDEPHAVRNAEAIRETLQRGGIHIQSFA
jgi:UPF0271 protein